MLARSSQISLAPPPNSSLALWLDWIAQAHPVEMDFTLERARVVANKLSLLSPGGTIVTVAGTNGKGSTVSLIESALLASGLSVGSISSPHLWRFNERININGEPASDQAIVSAFEAIEQARGRLTLTYYEYGVLAGFWLIKQALCEVAVLEVGLGGRLDTVNIVDADIAVITSIGLDHTKILGSTRELIGTEKAGIFREKQLVVVGDADPPESVLDAASRLQVELKYRGRDFLLEGDLLHFAGRELSLRQACLSKSSLATALVVLYCGFNLDLEQSCQAMLATQLAGRLQQIKDNVWLDVAHNPAAADHLVEELSSRLEGRGLKCVYATLADKDAVGFVNALKPLVDSWYLGATLEDRGISSSDLANQLESLDGLSIQTVEDDWPTLLQTATTHQGDDALLICGSFECVARATKWFLKDDISN